MNRTLRSLRLALALALASFLGAGIGSAATAPVAYSFSTSLTDTRTFGGAYEGVLNITIASDGTVQGTYRPAGEARIRNVTGGLSGSNIWLDLGSDRPIHIVGTFANGTIDGTTKLGAIDDFEFVAKQSQPHV